MKKYTLMLSIVVFVVALITWHFYCAASFVWSTQSIPWRLSTSETTSAHSYFYWPPAMRRYVSSLAREKREQIQQKSKWEIGDSDQFGAMRYAELRALLDPWSTGSEAGKAYGDSNAVLLSLRETVVELDKRK